MTRTNESRSAIAAAPRTARSTARAVWRVLSGALLTVLVLLAFAIVVLPAITGAQTFTITGRSMEPVLPLGSLIVTSPVEADELRTGDIITYQLVSGQPAVATHRVVGFTLGAEGRSFVTAGDNNDGIVDNEPVTEAQIKGRLWYALPLVGWVGALFNSEIRGWIIPVAAILLLAFGAWSIASDVWGRLHRRR